jgi:hypothetical protein
MKRGAGSSILLGTGTALYLIAIGQRLTTLFWPRGGAGLFMLALCGAGLGAAAVFLLTGRGGRGRQGRTWWILPLWALATLSSLFAFNCGVAIVRPVKDGILESISPLLYLVLTAPLFLAAVGVLAGRKRGAGRRAGLFAIALGVTMAVVPFFSGPSWFPFPCEEDSRFPTASTSATGSDGSRLVFEPHEGGWTLVTIDGGVQENILSPMQAEAPAVPLTQGGDDFFDILFVGFPKGTYLKNYLDREKTRVTVLEPDTVLVRESLRYWPELREAGEGRIRFVGGSPRRFLEGRADRYDLIALVDTATSAAHLARALSFRENYLFTVEAFRLYTDRLAPRGLLFVEKAGVGRVVTTLREAVGSEGETPFGREILVIGKKGGLVSQCYYRRGGYKGYGRDTRRALYRFLKETGAEMFFPQSSPRSNAYLDLVDNDQVRPHYVAGPLDLSPTRDRRPFFEHFGRVQLSPPAHPTPDEQGHHPEDWRIGVVPPEDRLMWSVLALSAFLTSLAVLVPLGFLHHRTGLAGHAWPYALVFLLLGAAMAASLRSVAACSRWLDPLPGEAAWAAALSLTVFGAGLWRSSWRNRHVRVIVPASLLFCFVGLGGYSLPLPALVSGTVPAVTILAALAAATGLFMGRAVGIFLSLAEETLPGTTPWHLAVFLLAAVAAWSASEIVAVTFGFPLLWLLAAAALLGAHRVGRGL